MGINFNIFTKSYALSYEIEKVPFYVDEDGDLTSNIDKAARMDKETAKALAAMYCNEGIEMNTVMVETAKEVTI